MRVARETSRHRGPDGTPAARRGLARSERLRGRTGQGYYGMFFLSVPAFGKDTFNILQTFLLLRVAVAIAVVHQQPDSFTAY